MPRFAALLLHACTLALAVSAPVDYVSTFIGSGGAGYGIGSINPGPQFPYGAMRLGPDTSLGLGARSRPLSMQRSHTVMCDPCVSIVRMCRRAVLAADPLLIPFNHFAGYYYNDDYIRAFSHTHMVGAGNVYI